MKTKIIPFDLETAKKIQAGEIKGKIVTTEGNSVRILCFDRKGFADKIIGLVAIDAQSEYGYELEISYCEDGSSSKQSRHDLVIELSEEAPKLCDITTREGFYRAFQKHEFKPFDKVLVRSTNNGITSLWKPKFFSNIIIGSNGPSYFTTDDKCYSECIPYEGNEHLVGTTDKPKEE